MDPTTTNNMSQKRQRVTTGDRIGSTNQITNSALLIMNLNAKIEAIKRSLVITYLAFSIGEHVTEEFAKRKNKELI
jgi:hypothetical protein